MTLDEFIALIEHLGFTGAGSTDGTPSGKFGLNGRGGVSCPSWQTRRRWARGDQRITVGKRTICVYRMGAKGPEQFQNIGTKEVTGERLKAALDAIA